MKPLFRSVLLGVGLVGAGWFAVRWWTASEPASVTGRPVSGQMAAAVAKPVDVNAPAAKLSAEKAGDELSAAAPTKAKKKKADRTPEEERAAQLAQSRRVQERLYGRFLDEQGLDAAKRATLISLLVDLKEASRDYAAAHAKGGVDATNDRELFDASVEAMRETIRERIKALLGEDGYNQYLGAEAEARKVAAVDQLEKELRRTSTPLTPAQGQQLLALLHELNEPRASPQVIERAGAFLSPSQVDALRADYERMLLGPKKENVQRVVREGGVGQP